mmetsp:Transcript_83723/g.132693  ORF Transcript_83723/g.132693 Transcript_83723/m.132693 type:complete len:128 (+) Transcript_83723:1-384(+)
MDELRFARSLKMELSLRLTRQERELFRQQRRSKEFSERREKVEAALQDMEEVDSSPDTCDTCPVCLDDLGHDVLRLPCGHRFHRSCISKWLAGPLSPACPSCKQPLTIPGLEKNSEAATSQVLVTNL